MLVLPDVGFVKSVEKHNSNRQGVCDWIEASVAFCDDRISQSDIVDVLTEKNVYLEQDFAAAFVGEIWTMLVKRAKLMGSGSPYRIEARSVRREREWQDVVPASFCMILTLTGMYEKWADKASASYVKQGHLFERLTKECLEVLGWTVLQTGWASGITNPKFKEIVYEVAGALNETFVVEPMIDLYDEAKEEGLDLVCHLPFKDGLGGKPVYLVQCASGKNWTGKRKTPDIEVWRKLIVFSADPVRAFAIPFALDEKEFHKTCNRVNGMVLDRFRLLSPGAARQSWISDDLSKELVEWLVPRVDLLPIDGV